MEQTSVNNYNCFQYNKQSVENGRINLRFDETLLDTWYVRHEQSLVGSDCPNRNSLRK